MVKALTVRQFNEYFKTSIRHDPIFSRVYIKGTLANIKYNGSHLYFSLKEGVDVIDCVIFYYEDKEIDFAFTEGVELMVTGTLNLNNYSSRINIIAKSVKEVGQSEEYLKFLKLKEDFRKKGYFDLDRKKPIGDFPKNIGLITSKDGAAIIDFISVINQKPNDIKIKLAPVKVQGDKSSLAIVDSIVKLDRMGLDAIVITRGGGSALDLAVFNDKDIIKAAYGAKTPIISAIGHKIDMTLLDLVADLSLQTPTEAGSYIIRNYANLDLEIKKYLQQMRDLITNSLRFNDLRVKMLRNDLRVLNPRTSIDQSQKDLESIRSSLNKAMKDKISSFEHKLALMDQKLKSMGEIIELRKKNIKILDTRQKEIYSKHSLKNGDEIIISFSDGKIKARVTDG